MLNPENCETSTVTAENVAPQPHASFLPLAVLPPLPALKASMSAEDILAIQKLFKELSSMNLFSLYSALLKLDKEMQLKYSQLDAASREVMRDKIERVLRPYQPLIKKGEVFFIVQQIYLHFLFGALVRAERERRGKYHLPDR